MQVKMLIFYRINLITLLKVLNNNLLKFHQYCLCSKPKDRVNQIIIDGFVWIRENLFKLWFGNILSDEVLQIREAEMDCGLAVWGFQCILIFLKRTSIKARSRLAILELLITRNRITTWM
jgi:hypothetical protein